jgi:hypothetical protein
LAQQKGPKRPLRECKGTSRYHYLHKEAKRPLKERLGAVERAKKAPKNLQKHQLLSLTAHKGPKRPLREPLVQQKGPKRALRDCKGTNYYH